MITAGFFKKIVYFFGNHNYVKRWKGLLLDKAVIVKLVIFNSCQEQICDYFFINTNNFIFLKKVNLTVCYKTFTAKGYSQNKFFINQ